jgi:ABC-type Fe3+-siderophore transport system permease subunit
MLRAALKGIVLAIMVLVVRQRFSVSAFLVGISVGVLIAAGTQYLWYYSPQRRMHLSLKKKFGETYMAAFRREADRTSLGAMIDSRWFATFSPQQDNKAAN